MNFASDFSFSIEDFVSSSASSATDLESMPYPEYDITRLLANTGIDGFPYTLPAISVNTSPSLEQHIRFPVHSNPSPEVPTANHSAPHIDRLDFSASNEQAAPAFPAVRAASAASVAVVTPGKRQSPRRRSPLRNRCHVHHQSSRKRFHLAESPADDLIVSAYSNNACESSDKDDNSECPSQVTKKADFDRKNPIDSGRKVVGVRETATSSADAMRYSYKWHGNPYPVVKVSKRSKSLTSPCKRAGHSAMSTPESKLSGTVTSSSEDEKYSGVMTSSHQRKTSTRRRKPETRPKLSGAVSSSHQREGSDYVTSSDYRKASRCEKTSHHVTSSQQGNPDVVTSSDHRTSNSLVSRPPLGRPSVLRRTSVTYSDRVATLKRNTVTSPNSGVSSSDPVLRCRHVTSSGRTTSPHRLATSNRIKKQSAREKFALQTFSDVGLNVCSRWYREMCRTAHPADCKMPNVVSRCSQLFHWLVSYQKQQQKNKKKEEFNFMTSLGPPDWGEVLCHQTRGMDVCRAKRLKKIPPESK